MQIYRCIITSTLRTSPPPPPPTSVDSGDAYAFSLSPPSLTPPPPDFQAWWGFGHGFAIRALLVGNVCVPLPPTRPPRGHPNKNKNKQTKQFIVINKQKVTRWIVYCTRFNNLKLQSVDIMWFSDQQPLKLTVYWRKFSGDPDFNKIAKHVWQSITNLCKTPLT